MLSTCVVFALVSVCLASFQRDLRATRLGPKVWQMIPNICAKSVCGVCFDLCLPCRLRSDLRLTRLGPKVWRMISNICAKYLCGVCFDLCLPCKLQCDLRVTHLFPNVWRMISNNVCQRQQTFVNRSSICEFAPAALLNSPSALLHYYHMFHGVCSTPSPKRPRHVSRRPPPSQHAVHLHIRPCHSRHQLAALQALRGRFHPCRPRS